MADFSGFGRKTMSFLTELSSNNDREWFTANKARYERDVMEPALAFVSEMGPRLRRISRHFEAVPKKSGGSIMRVYRDTRFSKNKAPYKTNVGIQFRHAAGKDVHAPGYYVHVEPGSLFLGVGMWHPEPDALRGIRERIAGRPADWRKARDAAPFAEAFRLEGGRLKRPPRGFDPGHPFVDDLMRKDFIAVTALTPRLVASRTLPDEIARRCADATPFMRFLCRAVDVPF